MDPQTLDYIDRIYSTEGRGPGQFEVNPYTNEYRFVPHQSAVENPFLAINKHYDDLANQDEELKRLGVDPRHPEKQGTNEDISHKALTNYKTVDPDSKNAKSQYEAVGNGDLYQIVRHENGVDVPTGVFKRKLLDSTPDQDTAVSSRTSLGNFLGGIGNSLAGNFDAALSAYDRFTGDDKAAASDAAASQSRRHAGQFQSGVGSMVGDIIPTAATDTALAASGLLDATGVGLPAGAALGAAAFGAQSALNAAARDKTENKSPEQTARDSLVEGSTDAALGAVLPGVGGKGLSFLFPSLRVGAKEAARLGSRDAIAALGRRSLSDDEAANLYTEVGHEAALRGETAGYSPEQTQGLYDKLLRQRLEEQGDKAFSGMDQEAQKAFQKNYGIPAQNAAQRELPIAGNRLANIGGDTAAVGAAQYGGQLIKHLNDPEDNESPTLGETALAGGLGGAFGLLHGLLRPSTDAAQALNRANVERYGSSEAVPPLPGEGVASNSPDLESLEPEVSDQKNSEPALIGYDPESSINKYAGEAYNAARGIDVKYSQPEPYHEAYQRAVAHEKDVVQAIDNIENKPSQYLSENGTYQSNGDKYTQKLDGLTLNDLDNERLMARENRDDALAFMSRYLDTPDNFSLPDTRDAELQERLASAPISRNLLEQYTHTRANVQKLRAIIGQWDANPSTFAEREGRFDSHAVFGDIAGLHGSTEALIHNKTRGELGRELDIQEAELENVRRLIKQRMWAAAGPEPYKAAPKKPELPAEPDEPESLIPFLRRMGGLKISRKTDATDSALPFSANLNDDLKSQDFLKQYPGLLRKNGLSPDKAARLAQEHGYPLYLPTEGGPEHNALHEALMRESAGDKLYSDNDREAVQAFLAHRSAASEAEQTQRLIEDAVERGRHYANDLEVGSNFTPEDNAELERVLRDRLSRGELAIEDGAIADRSIEDTVRNVLESRDMDKWEGRTNLLGLPIADDDSHRKMYEARRQADDVATSLLRKTGREKATFTQLKAVIGNANVSPRVRKYALNRLVDSSSDDIVARVVRTNKILNSVKNMTPEEVAAMMVPRADIPGYGMLSENPETLVTAAALRKLAKSKKADIRKALRPATKVVVCGR